ncbi:helix-turn-helix domain-containing protein [Cupriavidus sp. D39]|uniref:helix-turn-helix domain-containing protein n=1 Tax=Cupriavidus sp. D39 TaxID=2997877 RepID=UPI003B637D3D
MLAGIDLGKLGYACTRHVGTQAAMHVCATRAAQGLPIDQAARACGVSVGMLSKLENGKGVHLDYVLRTLDGLGLTMLVVPKDHVPLLERAASHAARESKACEVGRARDLEWD